MVVLGDIKKAFLQIRMHESERDALGFHWRPDANTGIDTYRFTTYPFLLGGVLDCYLDAWSEKNPEETERLRQSFYVDDILTGGQDAEQTHQCKRITIKIMGDAKFELHKWNSNLPQLEHKTIPPISDDEAS